MWHIGGAGGDATPILEGTKDNLDAVLLAMERRVVGDQPDTSGNLLALLRVA